MAWPLHFKPRYLWLVLLLGWPFQVRSNPNAYIYGALPQPVDNMPVVAMAPSMYERACNANNQCAPNECCKLGNGGGYYSCAAIGYDPRHCLPSPIDKDASDGPKTCVSSHDCSEGRGCCAYDPYLRDYYCINTAGVAGREVSEATTEASDESSRPDTVGNDTKVEAARRTPERAARNTTAPKKPTTKLFGRAIIFPGGKYPPYIPPLPTQPSTKYPPYPYPFPAAPYPFPAANYPFPAAPYPYPFPAQPKYYTNPTSTPPASTKYPPYPIYVPYPYPQPAIAKYQPPPAPSKYPPYPVYVPYPYPAPTKYSPTTTSTTTQPPNKYPPYPYPYPYPFPALPNPTSPLPQYCLP